MRLPFAILLAVFSACAMAQSDEGPRGSTPPGQGRDGSRPGDGAIQGGAIKPGERAGVPDARGVPQDAASRCNELQGMLREQCLKDAATGSAGGASAPVGRDPKVEPPPQNPR